MKPQPLKLFAILSVSILSILMSFILTEIVSYSRNTLLAHPEWISGKRLLSGSIMGSEEGFLRRNFVDENCLTLSAWHGYNEILFNRILHVGSMRFRFLLEKNGYLNILFNKNKDSFSGIRISRNTRFPSMFFHATDDGKFLLKEPVANLSLTNSWHIAEIIFKSNTLSFFVDNRVIQRIQETSLEEQVIGFRSGSAKDTWVDDVEVRDMDGNLIILENFRNDKHYWLLLLINFCLIIGIIGIFFVVSNKMQYDRKRTVFRIFLFQLCTVTVFAIYYSFDYKYWTGLYHYKPLNRWRLVQVGKQINNIEKAREFFFTRFPFYDFNYSENISYTPQTLISFLGVDHTTKYRDDTKIRIIRSNSESEQFEMVDDNPGAILNYQKRKPFSKGIKILFLGSSQMWGEGATFRSDRIAAQIQKNLSNHFGGEKDFYVINASKRGTGSEELLERHKNHLFLFQPDLVVINLSSNDKIDNFRENLNSLIEFNKNIKSRTLFVLEANSTEEDIVHLKRKHEVMSNLAKEKNIPWIDLHGYLAKTDVYDSGILWWDMVHLTSYGQKIAAGFITKGIIENFKSIIKD